MSTNDSSQSREKELFMAALDVDPGAREAFLQREGGGNAELIGKVRALLAGNDDSFLNAPAVSVNREETTVALGIARTGDRIGPYKILQQIGEGGCGLVYMAEQEFPVRRRVALKIIKLGMDTKTVIARFEAERQALAMMEHPNIARIYDAGATETGRPFFVMELVRGVPITEYCDENKLSAEQRIGLFIVVCQAIQHAHQKGVIHRDIKPTNILVTLHDGMPVPKIIDFGIAKAIEQRLTEKTLFTEFQAFIGTPAYMSPEQAEMSGLDIDTRSDIYSLGVLLYQLLTGKTPFDPETLMGSGIENCRRIIREEEPHSPSGRLHEMEARDLTTTASTRSAQPVHLIHLLEGDLDWIVMKCLDKDRSRRYASAHELAQDLHRYLIDEPIEARPPSAAYRLGKMYRRHRVALTAGMAVAATLIVGVVLTTMMAIRASRAEKKALDSSTLEVSLRKEAEKEGAAARLNEYVADMNLAHQSLQAGNFGRAVQLVEKHRPSSDHPDLRDFEWRYLWQLCQGDEHISFPNDRKFPIQSIAFSPQGDLIAASDMQQVTIWSVQTRTKMATLPTALGQMFFSPDGKHLAGMSQAARLGGRLRVFESEKWLEVKSLPGYLAGVSPDGKTVAMGAREGFELIETDEWKNTGHLQGSFGRAAFSGDGKLMVSDSIKGMQVWSTERNEALVALEGGTNFNRMGGPPGFGQPLAFSPDGKIVVTPNQTVSERGDFTLLIWNAQTGKLIKEMGDEGPVQHTSRIIAMDFSPDGGFLVTASFDHSLRIWDMAKLEHVRTLEGHLNEVWSVAFSPHGNHLASGGKDGGLKLWPVKQQTRDYMVKGTWQPLAFSKDSKIVAALNREGEFGLFNNETHELLVKHQVVRRRRGAFPIPGFISADLGTLIVWADGNARLVNTKTGESQPLELEERQEPLAYSSDGRFLLAGGFGRFGTLYDLLQNKRKVIEVASSRAAFTPDSSRLAITDRSNQVTFVEVPSAGLIKTFDLGADGHIGIEFSPDGKLLGVSSSDGLVRLFDAATGELKGICSGHKQGVYSIAFAPSGKTLATSSDDSTVKLWNLETFQELLTIRRIGGSLAGLTFSPDGRFLAGGSRSSSPERGIVFYTAPSFAEAAPLIKVAQE